MRRLGLVIILLLMAAAPAAAQLGTQVAVQAGTPEDKALTAINQASTPQQKLALLDKFAAEHPSGEMALMADQLYVSIYLSLKNYPKVYEYGDKALAIDPNNLQVGVDLVRAAQLQNSTTKIFNYGTKVGEMVNRYKAQPPPTGVPADQWAAEKQQNLDAAAPQINWVAGVMYSAVATERTEASLNRFMDAFPDSTYTQNAEIRMAQMYNRSGETEKLLAFVEKRVAVNPDDIGMQVLLADYLSGKGTDLDRASAAANKVIQLLSTATKPAGMTDAQWEKQSNGQKGQAYSALGQVYVDQKDNDKAVAAFEQAKPLLKDSTVNYARNLYRLGSTLAQMKRNTEARAALEEAAKLETPYRAMSEALLRKLSTSRARTR
ncbi:MAG: tetratricopeptide repeat protein [Acidobacteriota bacterium]|nr:tetratricopeptide repeat protein [Acidobacteriota bacterium]